MRVRDGVVAVQIDTLGDSQTFFVENRIMFLSFCILCCMEHSAPFWVSVKIHNYYMANFGITIY